jgi:putative ABC transport system permease protein
VGRWFTAEEDRPGSRLVVISDRLWRRRFNGDRTLIDRAISLQGVPHTVIGVMPPGFSFLDRTVDAWAPVGFTAASRTPRGRSLYVVGRLRPGVTLEQAQQDMTRVSADLTRMFPEFDTGWTSRVVALRDQLTGDARPALLVLLAAVAFVLLIACANVANLLLARATARQRELAVRAALGAGRARIVRQLLSESLILAAAGGACGLVVAWWALHVLRTAVAERLPVQRLEAVGLDGSVLLFTLGASLASAAIFGLVPALTASGGALNESLKEGGRTGSSGRTRTRNAFVVVEIALALVLLVGAGLLLRSFVRLLNVDPGFDAQRTMTFRLSLPGSRYGAEGRMGQFFDRLFQNVAGVSGVRAAGAVSWLPLTGLGAATSYEVVGVPRPPRGQEPVTDVRVISHDYLGAMGISLIRGRLFNERDRADLTNRVVVNQTLAERHWPGEDPIGKRIKISWSDSREDEIIGVVGDVRHASLGAEPRAMTYWPYARNPYGAMHIAVRADGDARAIAGAVIGLVRQQDPDLAVADVQTMEEVVGNSVAQERATMLLLAIFAGAALVLAAVGIYGVVAYSVTQRTQEIGIRMALGAERGDVLRMIVWQGAILAGAGILTGVLAAAALTRLMSGLLYETRPHDPLTFGSVAAVLAVVALTASLVPARRATRVDPVIALRAE